MSLPTPFFYDPHKSFEQNYKDGPHISGKINSLKKTIKNPKSFTFLGQALAIPFGIPAGPLIQGQHIKEAFALGFAACTYKTVRSSIYPSHPYPNILYVDAGKELHTDLTQNVYTSSAPSSLESLNITNSFGVPSQDPAVWIKDIRASHTYAHHNQLLITSFMGTVRKGQTHDEFIKDFGTTALLAKKTGVKVLEVNLSCPNVGNEGLVCYDIEMVEMICKTIRNSIGDTPLILKVGYYSDKVMLERIAKLADKYAQAIAVINTLQAGVLAKDGRNAFRESGREKSGICGAAIKWAGQEMVATLSKLRKINGYSYEIVGIGGVMNVKDYLEYRALGADLVQSATGSMWHPRLAQEVWRTENNC